MFLMSKRFCTCIKSGMHKKVLEALQLLVSGTHSVPILKILNKWWDEIEGFFEDGDETLNFTDARERNAPHFSQVSYSSP